MTSLLKPSSNPLCSLPLLLLKPFIKSWIRSLLFPKACFCFLYPLFPRADPQSLEALVLPLHFSFFSSVLYGAYILNYTTNENIVPILEAIQAQSKTEFLIQLHSGILFLLQQRIALVLA